MGQTVVFTVSLDTDDVAIEHNETRPPRRPFRDQLRTVIRDRRWRLAALVAFAVPLAAAAVTLAITRGPWVTTAYLAAAALATPASGAWAAARRERGDWDARTAYWLVAGLAGASLALVHVPFVAWAASVEQWGEHGAVPTLGVVALAGATGALIGVAVAARDVARPGMVAAALVTLLGLAPLGLYASLLPTTRVSEDITYYTFTTTYDMGRPAYVCGKEQVNVTRGHTEAIAWIAFASPVAWAVDAASFTPAELVNAADGTLAQAQGWTRSTRLGPDSFTGHCYAPTSLGVPMSIREARYNAGPLGAQVAIIAALAAVAAAAVTSARRPSPSASR